MSLCRVISYVVRNGCLLRPVCSLGKTLVSLCPASFYIPRPNLPGTPGVSWLPTFAFQSPMIKRISFSWYYLYKVLYLFIEPFNLSFSTISGWGIDLHYCDVECLALVMNQDHCFIFEVQYSSELNSPIPICFSSLIPNALYLLLIRFQVLFQLCGHCFKNAIDISKSLVDLLKLKK